jgi:hypothetical protein
VNQIAHAYMDTHLGTSVYERKLDEIEKGIEK